MILDKFKGKSVMVIGDVMLDRYVWTNVSRISPEAPIPVAHVQNETHVPGGSGNAANNLAKLGAAVHIVGAVGDDIAREQLVNALKSNFIDTEGLFKTESPTIVKTRVIANDHHIVRIDREKIECIDQKTQERMVNYIEKLMPKMDAIVISDYAKMMNSETLIRKIIEIANKHHVKSVVDSKSKNYKMFEGATIFTPNHKDADMMTGLKDLSSEGITKSGNMISKVLNCHVVMTRSKDGISIFDGRSEIKVPSRAKEVYDVSGAGDTVATLLAMGVACGASIKEAAELASYGAAIVISKVGTATTNITEIADYISEYNDK